MRAIEFIPVNGFAYANLLLAKVALGDIKGACFDWKIVFDLEIIR